MTRRLFTQRGHRKQSAAATALLVLTACSANTANEPPPETTAWAAAAKSEQALPPQADEAMPAPAPVPPPVDDDPRQIVGLDPGALDRLLGEPVRVRREGSAEIWQYRVAGACQIDAFVYRDAIGQRVTHIEVRRGLERLDDATARDCMRRMLVPPATS